MKNKIKIGKPYMIEGKSDIFGESVKLCANVTMKNPNTHKLETKECYFEFEMKYKEYLCLNRSDAFVMGLLITAMENNMDIEYEEPISEKLYYQMNTYYIPMVSKYNSNYPLYNIKLIGAYSNDYVENNGAVATGCSGGVDSFYTMLRHSENCETKHNKLTHIVFSSSGTADIREDHIKDNYMKQLLNVKKIAEECSLDIIACYNNLFCFYKFPYKGFNMFFTTTFSSVAFALQKLISVYYVSSGTPIEKFNLDIYKTDGFDGSAFDIFTINCICTENLTFYSTGIECTRIEKEKYISNYKPAQKLLVVCTVDPYIEDKNKKYNNCSKCPKCLRTMVQLYSLNKLEKFKKSFDVDMFFNNKSKYIGKMIGLNTNFEVKEMKKIANINNVKIPFLSYLYAYFWYKPIKFLRNILKNSLLARKIFYKFNLDYKIDGYRGSSYEAYKDKI